MNLQDWQIIAAFSTSSIGILGLVVANMTRENKNRTLIEVRLASLELEVRQLQTSEEKTEKKFDEIMKTLQEILIRLEKHSQ